jgi:mono/diheme cytochrome c family protein
MAPNLGDVRPPSLRSARIASMPPATLVAVITNGFGRMPPLGWQLLPAARAAIGAYVQTLGTSPETPTTRADSAMASRLRALDSLSAAGGTVWQILELHKSDR